MAKRDISTYHAALIQCKNMPEKQRRERQADVMAALELLRLAFPFLLSIFCLFFILRSCCSNGKTSECSLRDQEQQEMERLMQCSKNKKFKKSIETRDELFVLLQQMFLLDSPCPLSSLCYRLVDEKEAKRQTSKGRQRLCEGSCKYSKLEKKKKRRRRRRRKHQGC